MVFAGKWSLFSYSVTIMHAFVQNFLDSREWTIHVQGHCTSLRKSTTGLIHTYSGKFKQLLNTWTLQ